MDSSANPLPTGAEKATSFSYDALFFTLGAVRSDFVNYSRNQILASNPHIFKRFLTWVYSVNKNRFNRSTDKPSSRSSSSSSPTAENLFTYLASAFSAKFGISIPPNFNNQGTLLKTNVPKMHMIDQTYKYTLRLTPYNNVKRI
eukprot:IDg8521t1